jgi:hypothetical protein
MDAEQVLSKYWGKRSFPVDPFEIARLEGVLVVECDLSAEGLSGTIYMATLLKCKPMI